LTEKPEAIISRPPGPRPAIRRGTNRASRARHGSRDAAVSKRNLAAVELVSGITLVAAPGQPMLAPDCRPTSTRPMINKEQK